MPVNGLLLTLSANPELADTARRRVSARPEVLLGQGCNRWQPLVADTAGVKEAHDFHEWLETLPGVEQVDVIYVGFDATVPTETAL